MSRPRPMRRLTIAVASLCIVLPWAAAPALAAPPPAASKPAAKGAAGSAADAQQAAALAKLRKTALGADAAAAEAALAELKSLGEPARETLVGVLRQMLIKDKAAVLKASAAVSAKGAGEKFDAAREQIDATREAALANIAKLRDGEPVKRARRHHDDLVKLLADVNAGCAAREAIVRLMDRRPALLESYREVAPKGDAAFDNAKEAKLLAAAEKALGMSIDEAAAAVPSLAQRATPPDDPVLRHLWFYRACREIEAYNATLRPDLGKGEWANLVLVNRYREALGVLPYELDARLVQSARRHSREMNDEQYFSHQSPTPGLRTYMDRMRAAGYTDGAYSENIAAGPPDAEQTFWGWFDSPSHHKIMVHAGSTQIGIGQWDRLWTQHMGRGPRLMLRPPEERAKAMVIAGDVLKPRR
jgi:uncharacterized protein YkwD